MRGAPASNGRLTAPASVGPGTAAPCGGALSLAQRPAGSVGRLRRRYLPQEEALGGALSMGIVRTRAKALTPTRTRTRASTQEQAGAGHMARRRAHPRVGGAR